APPLPRSDAPSTSPSPKSPTPSANPTGEPGTVPRPPPGPTKRSRASSSSRPTGRGAEAADPPRRASRALAAARAKALAGLPDAALSLLVTADEGGLDALDSALALRL